MSKTMRKIRMENTHHSLISDGVPEHEQTLAVSRPFWVFFAGNLCIATWMMGVFVAGMGLDLKTALLTILAGSAVGSSLPAMTSIIGAKSRLSQIEIGRLSLGREGKKIPAFLNWIACIGWDTINNIASSTALTIWLSSNNIPAPFWLMLAILVGIQMLIGIYGHHFVQDFSKYSGCILLALFVIMGVVAMIHTDHLPISKSVGVIDILSAFVLLVGYNAGGWSTYTADYTRYLPRKTPSYVIFSTIFAGLFLSLFVMTIFGYMTAAAVADQTPEGVLKALQSLMGPFSGLGFFIMGVSCIPANAVNDNSAAYSLISTGLKISRPAAAVIGAVVGYIISVAASHAFVEFYENFILLFEHWVVPWAAVILVHWFTVGRHRQETPSGFTIGAIVFCVVSIASIGLFSSNALYTGPVATRLGGLDIGPYVGFIVASSCYYALLRFRLVKLK